MALVVSSTPLGALWAASETATLDERRPSSSGSSRRLSSGSSNADTCESSSGSFGAQRSNNSSNHSGLQASQTPTKSTKKNKQKRSRLPDVVIHVQDCSFAVDLRVLKRKCRVLHGFLLRLKAQNAVGGLAEAELDDMEPIPLYSVSGIVTGEAEGQTPSVFTKGGFVLRQRNPLTTPRHGGATQPHRQRCPILPKQHLSDRAVPTATAKSSRFSRVCCIAHQKSDDELEAQRPRSAAEKEFQREEYSPGKENYVATLSSSTVRPRPLSRIALAPKMPFMGSSPSKPGPRGTVAPAVNSLAMASTPTLSSASSDTSSRVSPDALDVELVGATADAVATFIEFVYSGRTSGLNESNAAVVTGLCKWFCLQNHLFYAALVVRARSMQSVDHWIDILLLCTNLRCEAHKKLVIDYLLGRLMGLPASEFVRVMQQMPMHRLAAIEDTDILARVMLCMVNHLRRVEIWKRLVFALELWLHWTYRCPFVAPSFDLARQAPVGQPMSLLDFHHQFVSWKPVVEIQDVEVSGIDAYVSPTTLFSIGPFAFQVRYEPSGKPLIHWRVVRAGTPADAEEDDRSHFRSDLEPPFTIRGRLHMIYKLNQKGPVLQDEVALRYTHTKEAYGKWHVLLSAPSAHTKAYAEPESEEKTQEPDSSLEEETAPHEDSDSEATAVALPLPVAPAAAVASGEPLDDSSSSPFEPMTTRFSGQLFAWGHRLCNLYHYLLLVTLFYQAPADAPPQLRLEATLARLRELPFDTLMLVLQSDRLRVPEGETALATTLATLCLSDFAAMRYSHEQIRSLFCCVRWSFVDLEQIMSILENSRPELRMYELIEQQLHAAGPRGGIERRSPWGVSCQETPYRSTTTLIEFQIEAGDRSLSPSKYLDSLEG